MKKKLYIPLMNTAVKKENRETYSAMLKDCGADTVFLALGRGDFYTDGNE